MSSLEPFPLISAQLRAARALVGWTAEDLARNAGVGISTVRRAETAERALGINAANETVIRIALERAGVIFVPENGEGPGVRLRKDR
jgi:transcriptional regulator with XRE-family HTH domain